MRPAFPCAAETNRAKIIAHIPSAALKQKTPHGPDRVQERRTGRRLMMPDLPRGIVTFLFTDIEGSTKLWEHSPEAMRPALARHDFLLREAIEKNGGHVFKTMGDSFCAVFPTASTGVAAAAAAQRALAQEPWAESTLIKARMALHTGAAEVHDNHDYVGQPLNRVARLLSAGHGGQVLLSLATQQLVRDS